MERTSVELERSRRIRLAVAAYAYEFQSTTLMSDAEFDKLSYSIDPSISTVENRHDKAERSRLRKLDKFFREKFDPSTGMWIHTHPELRRVAALYQYLHT
jgi:hypothetical protein